MKNYTGSNLLKNDIKNCVIHIINPDLGICTGLVIPILYNFTIKDITFVIHNKFNLGLFYNKNQELVIKIAENEKTKVVSEIVTGALFNLFDIDISNENLIPFNTLTTSLLLYNTVKKEIESDTLSVVSKIKKYRLVLDEFKKTNSYFVFNACK